MQEAKFYRNLGDVLRCELCPRACRIGEGKRGACLGRVNQAGRLWAATYGVVVSAAVDPIEKKPLYHFHPGSKIFSVATYGCNLACPFCQNYGISQSIVEGRYVSPERLVEMARRSRSIGIAYTYSEPLTWYEYLSDVCPLVRRAGMVNVLVTNGMINEQPLRELLPYIDAMNIDLKSARAEFYRDVVRGNLDTVKTTITLARRNCHVEVTNLVIPGMNDSDDDFRELVGFLALLGRDTVVHFSRYFPHYRLRVPPTPDATLERAYRIAREKLDYVYIGNASPSLGGSDTRCPDCGNLLVRRQYFSSDVSGIKSGKCSQCGRRADLIVRDTSPMVPVSTELDQLG